MGTDQPAKGGGAAQKLFTATTNGVRVTARPNPLQQDSEPERGVYAFAYTILIENIGDESVQLIERHWIITSAGTQLGEVVGPGVVGQQPVLEPGAHFEYTSSAVINDPIGTMEGEYSFRGPDGRIFSVDIPRFSLLFPMIIH